MENIDSVPSNVQSSRQEALLYVLEDNALIVTESCCSKLDVTRRPPTQNLWHQEDASWWFSQSRLGDA